MSPETGGNIVVPGSHREHHLIPERYPKRLAHIGATQDHFRYPENDPILATPIMCHMEPGDMILWDRYVKSSSSFAAAATATATATATG